MSKKILFVDDEPMIIKIMVSRLNNLGHEIDTALNGKEALKKASKKKYDAILLDILMPVMDGYEVCRKLKADPKTSDIPVIMFTANQSDDYITAGMRAGAVDVVSKPYVAELVDALHKVFNPGESEEDDE